MPAATRSRSGCLRADSTTAAPAAAHERAIASPMPRLAPVTSTTLSRRWISEEGPGWTLVMPPYIALQAGATTSEPLVVRIVTFEYIASVPRRRPNVHATGAG